jgi:hypothetical protein
MAERLKILFSGMVAGEPHQGGATWAVLQYVTGLTQLGHDVLVVEPVASESQLHHSAEVASYFAELPFLDGRVALHLKDSDKTLGLPFGEVEQFAREADLLINVSGMLRDERLLDPIPTRAFLDLDPGFNQVWHETGHDMGLDHHTHFVTVGQRVGGSECRVPDCQRSWVTVVPPVNLEHWQEAPASDVRYGFTTIGHWRSYGSVEYEGVDYGQRAHSFRSLIGLAEMTEARFQLALGIHPDEVEDLQALTAGGWELIDPLQVAGTPDAYANFIRGSLAELCVAKSGYVQSKSGWLSDRCVSYLASGRPVVAQETGITGSIPVGEGLLTFSSPEEAAAAVETIAGSWRSHGKAARRVAEECFDSRKVLTGLLRQLGATGR